MTDTNPQRPPIPAAEKNESGLLLKAIFILCSLAFFFVPMFIPQVRDYAPGLAVLLGSILAIGWGNPYEKLTSKLTSNMLGAAIVGMGFGMNLIEVLKAGGSGIVYTFVGISMGLSLGCLIGKWLKLEKNTTYLISIGTSICGGSAIAAAAPVLKAKAYEIAIASAVVFTLNAIALLIFPAIGHALNFDQVQFGTWAALGIHDTSSVVGASLAYGEHALEVGTTLKLARALWIVPVTLFASIFLAPPEENGKRKIKVKIPWFIPGFLLASVLVTYVPVTAPAGHLLKDLSKYLMILTLFFIGANLNRKKLKELGLKPIIQGVILWFILATVWLVAIATHVINPNMPPSKALQEKMAKQQVVAPAATPQTDKAATPAAVTSPQSSTTPAIPR